MALGPPVAGENAPWTPDKKLADVSSVPAYLRIFRDLENMARPMQMSLGNAAEPSGFAPSGKKDRNDGQGTRQHL